MAKKSKKMSATPVPPKVTIKGSGKGTGQHPYGYNTAGKHKGGTRRGL